MSHWSINYLGKTYIKGENDCWTVFCDVQNNVFDRNIQDLAFGTINELSTRKEFLNNPLRQRFKEVRIPVDGCAVFMSKGKYTSHIGTYLNIGEGRVLHCIEYSGTVIQSLSDLKAYGWNIVGFFEVE